MCVTEYYKKNHFKRWQHVYASAAFLICVPAASAVIVIALQYFAPVVACK